MKAKTPRKKINLEITRTEFVNKSLDLLEARYRNVHAPMAYRCLVCDYKGKLSKGKLSYNDFRTKNCGCKKCGIRRRSKLRRLDFESFKAQQLEKGFEILSDDYVNVETKLKVRHKICGYEWMVRPHSLRSKGSCPQCRRARQSQRQLFSTDFVAGELTKLGITLLSGYNGSQTPMTVRFNVCGHVVERTYNQLSRLPKCGLCAPNARASEKDYHATAKMFGGKILKIASRVNRNSLWLCPLGQHEFERSLASIRKLKTFCTICSRKYAETLCRVAIEKLFNAPFRSKRIPEMKSPKGRALELDIYNKELQIAVEHHGAHHYRALSHWSGVEGLDRQRLHDHLRREFCKTKGILLIEIRELGIRTSLEEMRQQIRDALLQNESQIPSGFDTADLTKLPQLSAGHVYWVETHEAAEKINLEILTDIFQGSEMPVTVKCKQGHITQKTPRSILEGHRCDECYMEQRKKPLQLSDGRVFESGTAAAKVLGVRKETVNKAFLNNWKVKGLGIKRISWNSFRAAGQKNCRQN